MMMTRPALLLLRLLLALLFALRWDVDAFVLIQHGARHERTAPRATEEEASSSGCVLTVIDGDTRTTVTAKEGKEMSSPFSKVPS